jgi:O-methyltransferase
MREIIKKIINRAGYEVKRRSTGGLTPVEISERERAIVEYVVDNRLSMVSKERLWATLMACKHVIDHQIPGDFVECGVWRGGNSLIAAALFSLMNASRNVTLFDTFGGMTAPTDYDKKTGSNSTVYDIFKRSKKHDHSTWCYASLEEVRSNLNKFGIDLGAVKFVQGDVSKTLNDVNNLPSEISVLRLDTDFYDSTKAELEILYPRLSIGGVLIIDDYGGWTGARKAVDEYFSTKASRPFLQYTDSTGRMGIKHCM